MKYIEYRKNIYSQNGEDGIIQKLIEELEFKVKDMWVVDVGAYDGISYSNVRALIEQHCNAVMVEPCTVGGVGEPKYKELKKLPTLFPKVITLNHFTKIKNKRLTEQGIEACTNIHKKYSEEFAPDIKYLDESLDSVKGFPFDYDILNIDIDSYDHGVWLEHTRTPKIVIIEINSSLPPSTSGDQNNISFADSIVFGTHKGYSCVCHTGNMIFVRNDLLHKLSIPKDFINSLSLFQTNWLS